MVVGWVGPKTANYQWALIGGVNLVEVAVRLPPIPSHLRASHSSWGVCAHARVCVWGEVSRTVWLLQCRGSFLRSIQARVYWLVWFPNLCADMMHT